MTRMAGCLQRKDQGREEEGQEGTGGAREEGQQPRCNDVRADPLECDKLSRLQNQADRNRQQRVQAGQRGRKEKQRPRGEDR